MKWIDYLIKPGKNWSLPLDAIVQTNCNFFKLLPVIQGFQTVLNFFIIFFYSILFFNNCRYEGLEMQIINWGSSSDNKLLNFNNKIFIQVKLLIIEYTYCFVFLKTIYFLVSD